MVKRPTFGTFKPIRSSKAKSPLALAKPPKAKAPPAMRKVQFENLLCQAIAAKVTVMLRYEDDLQFREYGPSVVYYSDQGRMKALVSGEQISNSNDYSPKNGPHNFEVGKIADLKTSTNTFDPDARISLSDNKYRHGIICPI